MDKPIILTSPADGRGIERCIDQAIEECGLTVALRTSLRTLPGSTHWHLKLGRELGTLELTLWPRENRLWLTVRNRRNAEWVDGLMKRLDEAIRRQVALLSESNRQENP